MRRVFVDSGAFFAHLVAEDAFHATAKALFDLAAKERWGLLTRMRDKPRRSGRGRIAPVRAASRCQTMLLQESRRASDLPPGRREVTPREIRAAQQGTRPRNPAVKAAKAAKPESPGLQAGEDVKTNVIVYETHALFVSRARNGRALGLGYLESDKNYSLCDALSFVVMERLGIEEAIAFDRHFREYGRFRLLAAPTP